MKKSMKKIASIALALVMILLAIPTMEAKAAQNVTVHFKNTQGWATVYAYAWNTAGELLGTWPGTDVTATGDGNGYYTATIEGYEEDSVNIIFGDGGSVQTLDLACDISKSAEWWVVPTDNGTGKWACNVATSKADAESGKNEVVTPEAPIIPTNPTVKASPVVNGNEVTFYFECENATQVEVFGTMNEWAAGLLMEKDGNVYSYTMKLEAGTYQYKYVVDGVHWITDPFNPVTADDGSGTMNSSFEVKEVANEPEKPAPEEPKPEEPKPEEPAPEEPKPEEPAPEEPATEEPSTEESTEQDSKVEASTEEDQQKKDDTPDGEPLSPVVVGVIAGVITLLVVGIGLGIYIVYQKKK